MLVSTYVFIFNNYQCRTQFNKKNDLNISFLIDNAMILQSGWQYVFGNSKEILKFSKHQ